MREIEELPVLTAEQQQVRIPVWIVLSLFVALAASGCGIKKTVTVEVPHKILSARTASFEELLEIIQNYENINDLSSVSVKVTLTYGKWEKGQQEEYREAGGYLLLRRPDTLRLVIQKPILKTRVFDVVSIGDDFSAWIPSQKKFYRGSNVADDLVADDLPGGIPLRAPHIYEAVLPQSLEMDDPDVRVSVEEAVGTDTLYYVLTIYREGEYPRIYASRKVWIERSGLVIARQQMFDEDGRIISTIQYGEMEQVDGFYLPISMEIDRPEDGYALNMEFGRDRWRVNRGLPDEGFVLTPPDGAEVIQLREKE
jgi:hypothetical protein